MRRIACLGLTLVLLLGAGCTRAPQRGVSLNLATTRRAQIDSLRYALFFQIPADRLAPVEAEETITLHLAEPGPLVLDFREDPALVKSISINGDNIRLNAVNEHIVIPKKYTVAGENRLRLVFTAGNQSLNRRDEFIAVTLLK